MNNLIFTNIRRCMSNIVLKENLSNKIVRLTLNDAKKRNAFSLNMMNTLNNQLVALSEEKMSKAIIIKSSTPVLSGGHNLAELLENKEDTTEIFVTFQKLMSTISNFYVPVIVSIERAAVAAGCQLVAACDLAVCGKKCQFSAPGIKSGLFCSTPAVEICRNIPEKIAIEMILTGNPISAEQALMYGLVNHVVEEDQVDSKSLELAETIASLSTDVIQLGKKTFRQQTQLSKSAAYELATETMVDNMKRSDALEGISAFLNKRKPQWSQ